MRRLGSKWGSVMLGCPVQHPFWSLRPPAPAAAWSETLKIILQQGRGGCGNERVAPATTSILHKAHNEKNAPPNIVNRSVRTLAAHTGPSRPKDATWPRRHGKVIHFRHGWEGLADRLTVGLVRGGNVGGPGATPCGAHNPGTPALTEVGSHGPWLIAR